MKELENVTPAGLVAGSTAAADYIEAGISPATRRAYASSWARWASWAQRDGCPALPAGPEDLVRWLAELAQAGRRPSTIGRHMAALATLHRARGLPSPTEHPALRALLRGIRRVHGTAPAQAAPLLLADLGAILPTGPGLRAIRDRALVLVGWAGALRRSELVGLTWGDVEPCREGLILHLRRSKTDQAGRGALVALPHGRSAARCPVELLEAWRQSWAGSRPEGIVMSGWPVFVGIDRWGRPGQVALSARAVSTIVGELAARAGLIGAYSGHSLRAGFCTSAAQAGVPERDIMAHSRHRSIASMRGYIRRGGLFLDHPATRML